jgi:hypothetical protein
MAPGTRIAHHFELIAQLEQDHRDLLRIYSGLRRASDAGRMQEAGEQLETFRHALQGHLLKENVKLYVYLEHTLAADATSHELMHGFRHEMDRIGKAVMVFSTATGTWPAIRNGRTTSPGSSTVSARCWWSGCATRRAISTLYGPP